MSLPAGILLVDKPKGPTSHDVVDHIRRAAGTKKVGHAGTLDPFATGVLILLLGSATRLSEYFLGMDKAYLATIRLGVETDTHDPEGEVTGRSQGWEELGETEVRQAMDRFRGENLQRPPVYSAKKIRGEPAHRRVRRGEGVELTPVPVQVHELELLETNLPDIRLHVRCSSGTYVRALARDLGVALGVGGHLAALRRTGIGPFDLDSALPLESFAQLPDVKKGLIPAADALSHLPSVQVGALEATRIRQGQSLPTPGQGLPEGTPICVTMGGELLAIAAREGGQLRPRKVLVLD